MEVSLLTNEKDCNPNQIILNMDGGTFMTTLFAACNAVLKACNPQSPDYADPYGNVSQTFDDRAMQADELAGIYTPHGRRHTTGQIHYLGIHSMFDIVKEYVEFRNANGKSRYFIGEDRYHMQYAYAAMCAFIYWKAKSLDKEIETNGTEFGSATGWFKTSYIPLIADWPEKFGVIEMTFELLEIPCLRPDWEQRRADWRDSRIEKLLSEASLPIIIKLRWNHKDEKRFDPDADLYVKDWGSDPRTIYVTDKAPDEYDPEFHILYPIDYDAVDTINGKMP